MAILVDDETPTSPMISIIEHSHPDTYFMTLAIQQAAQCTPCDSAYSVGCIITRYNPLNRRHSIVTTGYSREFPGNTHAEQCALQKLVQQSSMDTSLHSSMEYVFDNQQQPHYPQTDSSIIMTMYTTMEPCSTRLSGKESCSKRIIDFNHSITSQNHRSAIIHPIHRIVIGTKEPSHFVAQCQGIQQLRDTGVEVICLPDLEQACLEMNKHIMKR